MRALLLATTLVALPAFAHAATIITYGQTSGSNTVTGTANATGTHFSGTDIAVTITQIDDAGTAVPTTAYLDLAADSTSGATAPPGLAIIQHFRGAFSINAAADNSGTNYLSGAFFDGTFGLRGGSCLVLTSDGVFTSDVIDNLAPPRNFSMTFTNVTPPVSTVGTQAANSADCAPFFTVGCNDTGATFGSFTGSVSGNASAAIPEPATLGILGLGLLGIAAVRRRQGA
jgi:hypothetical protein